MKQLVVITLLLLTAFSNAQDSCQLKVSAQSQVPVVDVNDMKCLARTAASKNTLFYIFGIWCEPCRLHLPNAIQFAKENNLDFYVVLVEAENDELTSKAVSYLKNTRED